MDLKVKLERTESGETRISFDKQALLAAPLSELMKTLQTKATPNDQEVWDALDYVESYLGQDSDVDAVKLKMLYEAVAELKTLREIHRETVAVPLDIYKQVLLVNDGMRRVLLDAVAVVTSNINVTHPVVSEARKALYAHRLTIERLPQLPK